MDRHVYSFIDAGYLRKAFSDYMGQWFGVPAPIDMVKFLSSKRAQKTFVYDAIESDAGAPLDESDKEKQGKKLKELEEIRKIDGCHVSLGKLIKSSNGRFRQKEVDVKLAVDALDHAFRKNFTHCHIYAGDRDFVPLAETMIRYGRHVSLIGISGSVSRELIMACDDYSEMTLNDLHRFTTPEIQGYRKLPTFNRGGPFIPLTARGFTQVGTVNYHGDPIGLFQKDHQWAAFSYSHKKYTAMFEIASDSRKDIEDFCSMELGD